jgi:hypothetical protein
MDDPRHVAPQRRNANGKLFDLTGNSSVGTLPYPEVILRRSVAVQAMNAGVHDSFTIGGGGMATLTVVEEPRKPPAQI